jgi:prepilin peptidase CpaA
MPAAIVGIVVAVVVVAIATDLGSGRIPNVVTLPAALAGLGLNARYGGAPGLAASAAGLIVVAGLLLPAFALGGVGGGDVKMMAAMGALLGPARGLAALGVGLVAGGVVMAVHLARHGRLEETLGSLGGMIGSALWTSSLAPLRARAAAPDAVRLPYSVPLGLGALAVVLVGRLEGGW